ncbi:MAG: o-succinylbenzoate synthase [Candidatus Marinimicrobia bacterium]|nr:o-succinylbenzoate synthase [Candidatus Neomarinimicrobiota bacterium]|tara:strand:- start:74651 stop:75682 length:1032 start_codon:yes stop_codon:yes gene_type:complete
MKIQHINQTTCNLKLNKKFQNSHTTYKEKGSIILEIISDSFIGYGEICPLNHFSNETFQEINWGFQGFIESIDNTIDYSLKDLLTLAEIHCADIPSLHFGIDTALYDLQSKKNKVSLSKFLCSKAPDYIKLSSLYTKQKIYNTNTIKYKLGIKTIEEDIKILQLLQRQNKTIKFRLDANRKYSYLEFQEIYKKLNDEIYNIEYFEEPIKTPNIKILKKIKSETKAQIAIDESLYDGSDYKQWMENDLIHTVIIKPSILGGYRKILHLCEIAAKYNIKVIFSSALESGIGNAATIHLAAATQNYQEHGLNIYNFYDSCKQPLYQKDDNTINLKSIVGLGYDRLS